MSLAIATLTLFTACTADNDNPVSPTPSKELAEYTILYYGYGGGDLDEALLEKQFDMFKGNPDSYKKVKVACQYRFSSVESLKENYIGYLEIIKAPVITEKSTRLSQEENKYVFKVDSKATKDQIKKAIETIFKVKVVEISTLNAKVKKRRVGRYTGLSNRYKKAIVKLAEGQSIELN